MYHRHSSWYFPVCLDLFNNIYEKIQTNKLTYGTSLISVIAAISDNARALVSGPVMNDWQLGHKVS
jgi:hypothetical protein